MITTTASFYVTLLYSIRDKCGPLEDNAGNIITLGFSMAEELKRGCIEFK